MKYHVQIVLFIIKQCNFAFCFHAKVYMFVHTCKDYLWLFLSNYKIYIKRMQLLCIWNGHMLSLCSGRKSRVTYFGKYSDSIGQYLNFAWVSLLSLCLIWCVEEEILWSPCGCTIVLNSCILMSQKL